MAAVVCRLMVKKVLPSLAEEGFTLGLLHEIGRLGLNQSMPKQYELVLQERRIRFAIIMRRKNRSWDSVTWNWAGP